MSWIDNIDVWTWVMFASSLACVAGIIGLANRVVAAIRGVHSELARVNARIGFLEDRLDLHVSTGKIMSSVPHGWTEEKIAELIKELKEHRNAVFVSRDNSVW